MLTVFLLGVASHVVGLYLYDELKRLRRLK